MAIFVRISTAVVVGSQGGLPCCFPCPHFLLLPAPTLTSVLIAILTAAVGPHCTSTCTITAQHPLKQPHCLLHHLCHALAVHA